MQRLRLRTGRGCETGTAGTAGPTNSPRPKIRKAGCAGHASAIRSASAQEHSRRIASELDVSVSQPIQQSAQPYFAASSRRMRTNMEEERPLLVCRFDPGVPTLVRHPRPRLARRALLVEAADHRDLVPF